MDKLVIDVTWWQAVFALLAGTGMLAGMLAGMLRLWLQPQVNRWVDLTPLIARIERAEQSLAACQAGRERRISDVYAVIAKTETTLGEDIREIKGEIKSLSAELRQIVPELAGVKVQVQTLIEAVRDLTHHREPA